jgi:hypothetical protein
MTLAAIRLIIACTPACAGDGRIEGEASARAPAFATQMQP